MKLADGEATDGLPPGRKEGKVTLRHQLGYAYDDVISSESSHSLSDLHQEKLKILFFTFYYFFYKKVIKSYKKLKKVKKSFKKKSKNLTFFYFFVKKFKKFKKVQKSIFNFS